jgi:hypothetical protein
MYRIIGADGREYGPISAEQLRQWIAESRANAATRVQVEGSPEWKPLASLPEFSHLFAGTIPQPGSPGVFPVGTMPPSKSAGFATAGLILGIVSLTVGLCRCYGLPFNILGIVFSLVALGQIGRNPERYGGKGMAIAGLVLSFISLFLSVILLILFGLSTSWDHIANHAHRL